MPLPTPRPHDFSAGQLSSGSVITRRRALALLGSLLVAAATPTEARDFLFRDYGPGPHLASPDSIQAVAALLVDAQTGQVLYARNTDRHLLPASTTKLMTALIVYEKLGGMNGSVRIIADDRAEPSNIPVIPGEVISVYDLFHALLIESANDSARALGRAVGGSDEGFVAMMNARARAMGLYNTHFYNPNGLPAPSGTHYTCCADLMKIFAAVLRYPDLREIMSTKEFVIRTRSGTHILRNHNRLLGYYPGMGPAKTGWTVASRHTYAASVTRGGRQLLLTLLDSPDKWKDAMILFNWGFAQAATTPELPTAGDDDGTAPTASFSSAPTGRALTPAPAGRAIEQ
jgi:D-alanyl-D-alanine carboxypeptidase (penicillin-binding protein 5/6)